MSLFTFTLLHVTPCLCCRPDPRSRSLSSSDRVTILLRCPPVSACVWCVKLYSTVLAGCVVLFSFLWVIGHSYVLSVTEEGTLRVQR